jgi:tetratricopeptide (TPR) repeat protein
MPEAYYNLGLTLYRQGNVNDAIALYQKALSLKGDLAPLVLI